MDFLSSRVAVDDRLRPLSASLNIGMKKLQHTHMQLSDAAKLNTQAHTLLEAAHTLLHHYQVNARTHTHTHTHTWLLLKKLSTAELMFITCLSLCVTPVCPSEPVCLQFLCGRTDRGQSAAAGQHRQPDGGDVKHHLSKTNRLLIMIRY